MSWSLLKLRAILNPSIINVWFWDWKKHKEELFARKKETGPHQARCEKSPNDKIKHNINNNRAPGKDQDENRICREKQGGYFSWRLLFTIAVLPCSSSSQVSLPSARSLIACFFSNSAGDEDRRGTINLCRYRCRQGEQNTVQVICK